MKPATKKTAGAAPLAPAPDVPQDVPQADPLGLIPGVNDDPNTPPPDDDGDHVPGLDPSEAPTVLIPPLDQADDDEPTKAPEPMPGVVTTKDGRERVVIRAELPPPPPEPRAGRAPRKSDQAAAYYHRLNPGCDFAKLSLNDQALWYDRAVKAGGLI